MKRIGYLFERVIDPENLRLAFIKASRGKRHREDQRAWQEDLDREIVRLREGLMNMDYPIGAARVEKYGERLMKSDTASAG